VPVCVHKFKKAVIHLREKKDDADSGQIDIDRQTDMM
jgi:hypothetical protein